MISIAYYIRYIGKHSGNQGNRIHSVGTRSTNYVPYCNVGTRTILISLNNLALMGTLLEESGSGYNVGSTRKGLGYEMGILH